MAKLQLPAWVGQWQTDAIAMTYIHHSGKAAGQQHGPLRRQLETIRRRSGGRPPGPARPMSKLLDVVALAAAVAGDLTQTEWDCLEDFHNRGEKRQIQTAYLLPIVGQCETCSAAVDAAGIPSLNGDWDRSRAHSSFDRAIDKFPAGAARDQFLRQVEQWCDNGTETTLAIDDHGGARSTQQGTAFQRRNQG